MKKSFFPPVRTIITKFRQKDIFTLAAAVAFYAFLSIFPFLIMLLYVSSLILKDAITVEKIELNLRLFPPHIVDTIIANLDNIMESGKILSAISFLFLIYFAFKVFRHIEQALNKIFGEQNKVAPWRFTLKTFVFFVMTSFVLIVSFFTGNTILVLASKTGRIPLINSYILMLLVHASFEILFFALSYKFLARRKIPYKGAFIGGFVATILWEILKHIFGVYIVRITLYSVIYGSIGSLILLLLWLYYSILVYLLGAEIAMEVE